MIKKLWRALSPNPLDRLLKSAAKSDQRSFLICWNRGLGDIALGLYALVMRIRTFVPSSTITFFTRPDLAEAFSLLGDVEVESVPQLKRGERIDIRAVLGERAANFDVLIERPDPTYWLQWQLGKIVPLLKWNEEWDSLWESFEPLKEPRLYIGVHVQTETKYGYEKNWPKEKWELLFRRLREEKRATIILFGNAPTLDFNSEGIIDLRGKTNVMEMLSIIKNCCTALIVPDSGVLSLTYYLAVSFPLKVISLWSDPRQGVLKQGVPSPNPQLVHCPLIGKNEHISEIAVEEVMGVV